MAARLPSINGLLVRLALACLLPATVMYVAAMGWSYSSRRAEIEVSTIATARALMFGIDEHLHSVTLGLSHLSQSRALAEGNLGAFHEQALALANALPLRSITLVDAQGRQLVNTRTGAGNPEPGTTQPNLARLLDAREPRVLDFFITPVEKRAMVGMGVAVRVAEQSGYALVANVDPADLGAILRRSHLPPDWIAAVLDSQGTIVGRTHDAERVVGTPARASLIARIREVPEDAVESVTVDGVPVVTAFSRSGATGWSVAIGVPRSALTAPLRQALWLFAAASALALAGTAALSRRLARRISSALDALASEARSVGYGNVSPPIVGFVEAERLAQSLVHADAAVHDAETRRARAEALLQSVSESSPAPLVAIDADERIVHFNAAAERMFRVGAGDVLGKPLRLLLPRPTGERFDAAGRSRELPAAMRALRWEGEPFTVEVRVAAAPHGIEPQVHTLLLREA